MSFSFCCPGPGADGAREVADAVTRALDAPFQHEGGEVRLSASVGIALCPEDGDDEKRLIKGAHTAKDVAKGEDGGPVCFYGDTPERTDNARLAMEAELHRALGRDQFALHYQPQIDISTGLTVGAEALLRWRSPRFGLVAPDAFIPVLEENGQIVPVGEWVLRTACLHARAWQPAEGAPFRVAVNVSARQLSEGDFAETVRRVLEETDFDPAALEIEVTETAAMSNAAAATVLIAVCKLGVNVSLDDFGDGLLVARAPKAPAEPRAQGRPLVRVGAANEHGRPSDRASGDRLRPFPRPHGRRRGGGDGRAARGP